MTAAKKLQAPTVAIEDVVVPADRKRGIVSDAKVAQLAESISLLGLLNPITLTPARVLVSGLHRLEACRSLGWEDVPAITIKLDELHAELAEIDENLIRNELTVLQRSEQLQRRMEIKVALGEVSTHGGDRKSSERNVHLKSYAEEAGGELGVHPKTVREEMRIARVLSERVKDSVRGTSIENSKTDLLDLVREKDPAKQAAMVLKVKLGEASSVKEARGKIRLDEKHALAGELNSRPLPAASGKFNVIVLDPPWRYDNRAEDVTHRGRNPYPDMDLESIKSLPVVDRAEPDCIVWLWTTNAFMREAFECLDAWGFEQKTILTWVKDRMGTGDWLRGKSEHCLLAVRGKPIVQLTNQTTVLEAQLREHSRKPDEFFALVESLCPGTRLEMFARQKRDGWQAWGAETETFKEE